MWMLNCFKIEIFKDFVIGTIKNKKTWHQNAEIKISNQLRARLNKKWSVASITPTTIKYYYLLSMFNFFSRPHICSRENILLLLPHPELQNELASKNRENICGEAGTGFSSGQTDIQN
jgi:hypothetical protein